MVAGLPYGYLTLKGVKQLVTYVVARLPYGYLTLKGVKQLVIFVVAGLPYGYLTLAHRPEDPLGELGHEGVVLLHKLHQGHPRDPGSKET